MHTFPNQWHTYQLHRSNMLCLKWHQWHWSSFQLYNHCTQFQVNQGHIQMKIFLQSTNYRLMLRSRSSMCLHCSTYNHQSLTRQFLWKKYPFCRQYNFLKQSSQCLSEMCPLDMALFHYCLDNNFLLDNFLNSLIQYILPDKCTFSCLPCIFRYQSNFDQVCMCSCMFPQICLLHTLYNFFQIVASNICSRHCFRCIVHSQSMTPLHTLHHKNHCTFLPRKKSKISQSMGGSNSTGH
jgi:hypothetical protein